MKFMITFSVKLELIILMTILKFTGYPFKRFYFDKYFKTYKARNYLNSVHLYSVSYLFTSQKKSKFKRKLWRFVVIYFIVIWQTFFPRFFFVECPSLQLCHFCIYWSKYPIQFFFKKNLNFAQNNLIDDLMISN